MRMWGVSPKGLCQKHLLGEHVEMHMFAGTIRKGYSIAGYLKNNLISPSEVVSRHDQLAQEMEGRGMNHKSPLELDISSLPAEQQNLLIDKEQSRSDLLTRCKECEERHQRIKRRNNIEENSPC